GKGFTAVDDSYVFSMLEKMKALTENDLEGLPSCQEIARRLSSLCERQMNPNLIAANFYPWENMSGEEKLLRAQALFIQLRDWLGEKKMSLDSPRKISTLVDFLITATKAKPQWGAIDLHLIKYIKTWIRVTEAITALISLGVDYGNIKFPLELSWYTSYGRRTTAQESDIDKVKNIIEIEKPDLLITNGEGFPDYDVHSTTEVSVYLALLALIGEGKLDPKEIIYLQYAGVWERVGAQDADFSVVLSGEELNNFSAAFRIFYRSQSPAPLPDPATTGVNFFSDQVSMNASITRDELFGLLARGGIPPAITEIMGGEESGVLNYKIVDLVDQNALREMGRKREELLRVGEAKLRSSNEALQGSAPRADISEGLLKSIEETGIPIEKILGIDELTR
ncbi:MAG: hypothetical protein ABIC18_01415, partial [Candidatus Omnitrophota bacterium]